MTFDLLLKTTEIPELAVVGRKVTEVEVLTFRAHPPSVPVERFWTGESQAWRDADCSRAEPVLLGYTKPTRLRIGQFAEVPPNGPICFLKS